MIGWKCPNCGHEWAGRRRNKEVSEPPKKCPRCQTPFTDAFLRYSVDSGNPLADATAEELAIFAKLLVVLRNDPILASGLRNIAETWEPRYTDPT